jgi:hypothetical protein
MRWKFSLFFVGVLFLILPFGARAFSIQSGETVFLAAGEVITETLLTSGERVEIKAPVNGDVFVVGGKVIISGEVLGDVIAAGGEVLVSGKVAGDVRVAGGNVTLAGIIEKSVTVFGGDVTLTEKSEVGWSVMAFGGNVEFLGKVGRDVLGAGGNLVVGGEIGGDVKLNQGEDEGAISLQPSALVGGNFEYTALEEADIQAGAQILGETIYTRGGKAPGATLHFAKALGFTYIFFKMISLFGLLVVGLVLVSLFKKGFVEVAEKMIVKPWSSLGRGLAWFIIVPIAAVLLFITIIGIPLSLLGLVLYFVSLYLARIFAGVTIGHWVLHALGKKKRKISVIWAMIFGTVLIFAISLIPIVGWFINLVTMLWAFGALIDFKREEIIKRYR